MTGRHADCDIISIDPGYSTPSALEGRSCLYVLRYSASVRAAGWTVPPLDAAAVVALSGSGEGAATAAPSASSSSSGGGFAKEAGVWFYVGETDAIRERLQQHARRWGGGSGSGGGLERSGVAKPGGACKLDAIVLAVENRSEARQLETAAIRAMKAEGFFLVSDKDGSRTHFSSPGPAAS